MTKYRRSDGEMDFPVSGFINRSSYQQMSEFLGLEPEEIIILIPTNDEPSSLFITFNCF